MSKLQEIADNIIKTGQKGSHSSGNSPLNAEHYTVESVFTNLTDCQAYFAALHYLSRPDEWVSQEHETARLNRLREMSSDNKR